MDQIQKHADGRILETDLSTNLWFLHPDCGQSRTSPAEHKLIVVFLPDMEKYCVACMYLNTGRGWYILVYL